MTSVAAAAAPGATSTTCALSKPVDLTEKLDKTACYARNEHSRFPWTNLLIGDTRLGCKSDADEQIILHFEFGEFVKVHSVKLTEFNNGCDPEENPSRKYYMIMQTVFAAQCGGRRRNVDSNQQTKNIIRPTIHAWTMFCDRIRVLLGINVAVGTQNDAIENYCVMMEKDIL
jgi:hypothetical protein